MGRRRSLSIAEAVSPGSRQAQCALINPPLPRGHPSPTTFVGDDRAHLPAVIMPRLTGPDVFSMDQGSPITDAKSKADFDWFDTVREWMWICTSRDRS
jgi:hypothetical protein